LLEDGCPDDEDPELYKKVFFFLIIVFFFLLKLRLYISVIDDVACK